MPFDLELTLRDLTIQSFLRVLGTLLYLPLLSFLIVSFPPTHDPFPHPHQDIHI
jgi:hypothetical protein